MMAPWCSHFSTPQSFTRTIHLRPLRALLISLRALCHYHHISCGAWRRDRAEAGVHGCAGEWGGQDQSRLAAVLLRGHQTDVWLWGSTLLKAPYGGAPSSWPLNWKQNGTENGSVLTCSILFMYIAFISKAIGSVHQLHSTHEWTVPLCPT